MGKLLIFSAPSGSGKTTIVKEVIKQIPNLEFSISACSRSPRKGEVDGKDYYFLSVEEFKQKIENNEFIEYEEVYTDQFYGTLRSELNRIWEKGNHVVFDVDVKGGLNIKSQFPQQSLAIFIKVQSIVELKNRLISRETETIEQIEKRLQKALYEMGFADKFDTVILNYNLEIAIEQTIKQIKEFLGIKIGN
jgi:guanylate kinase